MHLVVRLSIRGMRPFLGRCLVELQLLKISLRSRLRLVSFKLVEHLRQSVWLLNALRLIGLLLSVLLLAKYRLGRLALELLESRFISKLLGLVKCPRFLRPFSNGACRWLVPRASLRQRRFVPPRRVRVR